MSYKQLLRRLIALLFLITISSAHAKDYAIEVILFANKTGLYDTAEQFAFNQIIPAPSNGIALEDIDINLPEEELPAWRPVAEEEFILQDVASRLVQSGRYRILKHVAWRQPAVDKISAQPILVRAGRDFSDLFPERAYRSVEFSDTLTQQEQQNITSKVFELDGTLNIVIGRYIHLHTDLVYRLPRSNPTQLRDAMNRDQILVDYAVKSHRRMRSRELHYIDHPLVGILVEATPIEEDESN